MASTNAKVEKVENSPAHQQPSAGAADDALAVGCSPSKGHVHSLSAVRSQCGRWLQSSLDRYLLVLRHGQSEHLTALRQSLQRQQSAEISIAAIIRDICLGRSRRLFDADCVSIEKEYSDEQSNLKCRLLGELSEKLASLQQEKEELETGERSARKVSPNGDQQANGVEGLQRGSNGGKRSRKRADLESKLRKRAVAETSLRAPLGDSDIAEDLFLIFGERHNGTQLSKRKGVKSSVVTSESGNGLYTAYFRENEDCLIYDSISYRKGDEIVIERDDENLAGEIAMINPGDFVVVLVDGTRQKLLLSHLRQGKLFISHLGSQ